MRVNQSQCGYYAYVKLIAPMIFIAQVFLHNNFTSDDINILYLRRTPNLALYIELKIIVFQSMGMNVSTCKCLSILVLDSFQK